MKTKVYRKNIMTGRTVWAELPISAAELSEYSRTGKVTGAMTRLSPVQLRFLQTGLNATEQLEYDELMAHSQEHCNYNQNGPDAWDHK